MTKTVVKTGLISNIVSRPTQRGAARLEFTFSTEEGDIACTSFATTVEAIEALAPGETVRLEVRAAGGRYGIPAGGFAVAAVNPPLPEPIVAYEGPGFTRGQIVVSAEAGLENIVGNVVVMLDDVSPAMISSLFEVDPEITTATLMETMIAAGLAEAVEASLITVISSAIARENGARDTTAYAIQVELNEEINDGEDLADADEGVRDAVDDLEMAA